MTDSQPDAGNAAEQPSDAISSDPMAHEIVDQLPANLRDSVLQVVTHEGQTGIFTDRDSAHALLQELRDQHGYDVLTDVTAVDYLNKDMPERFQVVYVLNNREHLHYLRVHAWLPEEDPTIQTVYDLWHSARWGERECHDMFGIEFDGAPDLRRFLMPEDYPGFPLLKDYPLKGKGERVQFPRIVPQGDEVKVREPEAYPTSVGRGMHTPEYLREVERDSKPKS